MVSQFPTFQPQLMIARLHLANREAMSSVADHVGQCLLNCEDAQHASARAGRNASALKLRPLWKVQIWREQSSANEARRSGGEYPRAMTAFRTCTIATNIVAPGIPPI